MADRSSMPEAGRQAAHVWLDAVSAHDPADDSMDVVNRALERMNDAGAVTAAFDERTAEVTVDYTDLAGGTITLIDILVKRLAAARGIDPAAVVHEIRRLVDAR